MNSDFDMGPHRRLFLSREAAKLTQKDAAAAVDMTRARLARCESGLASPSLTELKNLCMTYGVTPSFILMGASLSRDIARAMRAASARPLSAGGAEPEQGAEHQDS